MLCLERCGKPCEPDRSSKERVSCVAQRIFRFSHGNLALACYRFRTAAAFTKRTTDFPRKSMYTSDAPYALDGNLESLELNHESEVACRCRLRLPRSNWNLRPGRRSRCCFSQPNRVRNRCFELTFPACACFLE